ncbi:MAG: hypothetical protein A2157_03060 [Deltaproteobacteria bacterium RBG_16_47_11]|nr:MAG: hypothetical protein A2157_03060 [Deltaproteobacteria bacterium RBG_16_47_11]
MIRCGLSGACSLGVPGMIEHYQERKEASRYSNICLELRETGHDSSNIIPNLALKQVQGL